MAVNSGAQSWMFLPSPLLPTSISKRVDLFRQRENPHYCLRSHLSNHCNYCMAVRTAAAEAATTTVKSNTANNNDGNDGTNTNTITTANENDDDNT